MKYRSCVRVCVCVFVCMFICVYIYTHFTYSAPSVYCVV